MEAWAFWWSAAAVLAVAEVMAGTFTLLVLAVGAALGGLTAFLGGGTAAQLFVAALSALIAFFALRQIPALARFRPHWTKTQISLEQLDLGAIVEVKAWHAGHARVSYRGSWWDADLDVGVTAQAGPHRIVAVSGNTLILAPVMPAPTHVEGES